VNTTERRGDVTMRAVMLEDLEKQIRDCQTRKEVDRFIKKYRKVQYIGDFLISTAEEKLSEGEYEKGITILFAVYESKYLENVYDGVTVYLRLAEYYLQNGETEKGKAFLVRLCNETVENYEEALEFRKLMPVWEKYKSLVKDCVQPSVRLESAEKKALSEQELLELLLEEVGSGGFDAYLSYNSNYFYDTLTASETQNKPLTAALLREIEKKFPNGKVPHTPSEAENFIMDNHLDFEKEDEYFYETVERELA